MLRLVENLTLGPGAAAYRTESMHEHEVESPQAVRIMLARLADLETKARYARRLAGMEGKSYNSDSMRQEGEVKPPPSQKIPETR